MPVVWRILDDRFDLILGFRHEAIAQPDQRLFRLPFRYYPGSGDLIIYVNGVFQHLDVDYEESSDQTVTFLWPLAAGDRVVFLRRLWLSQAPQGASGASASPFLARRISIAQPTTTVMLGGGDRFLPSTSGEVRAEVYVNGQLQLEGLSYSVITDAQGYGIGFAFTDSLQPGDEVYVRWVPA